MGRKRQLYKQEGVRNTIIEVARKIVIKEGFQGLSIRKITNEMDYSPGIIYHYFKNKEEIIESLVNAGYRRLLASLATVRRNENEPEKEIREAFTKYIKEALASPEEYKAFILSDSPSILEKTSLLARGTAESSRTLQFLCEVIQRGVDLGRFTPCDPEFTAQVIWTSTFGLIMKLIIEEDIDQEQIERLIDQNMQMVFNGILAR